MRAARPRIPSDLLVAPLVSILLMATLLWVGSTGLSQVVGQADQIAHFNLAASVRIARIANAVQAINAQSYYALTKRAGEGGGEAAADFHRLDGDVANVITELTAYRDTYATAEQRQSISDLIGELATYQDALRWVGAMLEIDFTAAISFIRPFNAMFERLDHLIETVTDTLQRDAREHAAEAAHGAGSTGRVFLLLTVATAAGAVIAAWGTGRSQLRLRITTQELESQVQTRTGELVRVAAELRAAKEQAEVALTETRATQHQLLEAEKMAALGSLVAGVAHEVNTPIGSALTAASVLEERTKTVRSAFDGGTIKKAELGRYLDGTSEAGLLILSNLHRAAELILSFKQVAVDQTSGERRRFVVNTCIEEILTSLRPRLKRRLIDVQVNCPPDLWMDSYPGALSQVVTNLVVNSLLHAYGEKDAGIISLAVRELPLERIQLTYGDDGTGMAASVLARIFEPFFTTKRGAGGTGLGMHIVYNNVTQRLGGTITADSTEGVGTLFVLSLPRLAPAASDHPAI